MMLIMILILDIFLIWGYPWFSGNGPLRTNMRFLKNFWSLYIWKFVRKFVLKRIDSHFSRGCAVLYCQGSIWYAPGPWHLTSSKLNFALWCGRLRGRSGGTTYPNCLSSSTRCSSSCARRTARSPSSTSTTTPPCSPSGGSASSGSPVGKVGAETLSSLFHFSLSDGLKRWWLVVI